MYVSIPANVFYFVLGFVGGFVFLFFVLWIIANKQKKEREDFFDKINKNLLNKDDEDK